MRLPDTSGVLLFTTCSVSTSCLGGELPTGGMPPVDLRAVCFVLAMLINEYRDVVMMYYALYYYPY